MKLYKKISVTIIAIILLIFNFNSVIAKEIKIDKEEIVYVNLDYSGKVKYINVVNMFNSGKIIDYGDYSKVKNLNFEDKIEFNKDKIEFYSDKENTYYQGTMKYKNLPWNISIKYLIDEKEYKKDEIIGKDGKLKIKISIDKNNKFTGSFYEDFSLQLTVSLNMEKFKNIKANYATIVNAGKKKQLIYTIMPGENLKTEILADVENFELEPIQINGIKLNIDNLGILNKSREFKNSIVKINNVTNELKNGSDKIKEGIFNFKYATNNFKNGTHQLNNGILKIEDGILKLQEGLDTLNEKSKNIKDGSGKIKDFIKEINTAMLKINLSFKDIKEISEFSQKILNNNEKLYQSISKLQGYISYKEFKDDAFKNNLNIEKIKNSNNEIINNINNKIKTLQEDLKNTYKEEENLKLKAKIDEYEEITKLINLNNETINFIENYLNFIDNNLLLCLNEITELKNKYNNFNKILLNSTESLEKITYNIENLSKSINNLLDQYNNLEEGIAKNTFYMNNFTEASKEIKKGILEISEKSKILKENSDNMLYGINILDNNFNEFYNGIINFNNKISDLNNKSENKLKNILNNKNNKIIESFASKKNKNVKSVQFIMKTEYIETEKEKIKIETSDETEKINFLEKLKNLFK